jgi:hypothetical protein
MVFIFVSIFEFSASSTSTYFALGSVCVLEAAGSYAAIGAADTAGLYGAVEALDALGLPGACGRAVPLKQSRISPALSISRHCSVVCALITSEDVQSRITSAVARIFAPSKNGGPPGSQILRN